MQKSGDVSSAFIRDDAFQSLEYMVNNASCARVCTCLIASGAKYNYIYLIFAYFLESLF
jgi:hypothetical protein